MLQDYLENNVQQKCSSYTIYEVLVRHIVLVLLSRPYYGESIVQ